MKSVFKPLLIAGLLATVGFTAVAQGMGHEGGMRHGKGDPAKMQQMMVKRQDDLKAKLKHPVIFDGRNLYDPKLVRAMGFEYLAIGR